jgi:hypothetical protein
MLLVLCRLCRPEGNKGRRISGAGAGTRELAEEAAVFRPEKPDVRYLQVSPRISNPVIQ